MNASLYMIIFKKDLLVHYVFVITSYYTQVIICWRGSPLESLSSTLLRNWSLRQEHQEDISGWNGVGMETLSGQLQPQDDQLLL